jgi:putative SOS response-associated peptidase YedK
MCGRYTLKAPVKSLVDLFQLAQAPELPFRYNISPTQQVPAVRVSADRKSRELGMFRWGLIPSWAKDAKIGNQLINARSETVAEKPAFRSAFRKRRCLMPADGFYEWKKEGTKKQPFYIHLKNGSPFAFAALWEDWPNEEGKHIQSCTILTTEADKTMKTMHERMPIILPPENYEKWLDPEFQDPKGIGLLLQPLAGKELAMYPVSPLVNNPRNEKPQCIEPAG